MADKGKANSSYTPGIARDSHYVPMAVLRRWSTDGTHLYVYRLLVSSPKVPAWQRRAIRGVAYQRDLYTLFAGDQELDDLEKWLSREFEQPGLEAIDKVLAGSRLTATDWRRMARFLASQDVRTPLSFLEFRKRWHQQIPEMLDLVLKESIARVTAAKSKGLVLDEKPQTGEFSNLVEVTIDRPGSGQAFIRAEVPAGRRLWVASIRSLLTGVAEGLCGHRWSVAQPDGDTEWPLTDHPVLRLNYYKVGHYDFAGGWGNPGSEILMPLSPRHLLYVQVGKKSPNRFTLSAEHTHLVQRLLVERAHRWVFATRPTDWVARERHRTADPEIFAAEAEAWSNWHKDQLESEVASAKRKVPSRTG